MLTFQKYPAEEHDVNEIVLYVVVKTIFKQSYFSSRERQISVLELRYII